MFRELMQILTMGPFFVSDIPNIEIEEIVKTTYLNIQIIIEYIGKSKSV